MTIANSIESKIKIISEYWLRNVEMTLKTGRWNCLTHTSRCAPYLTAHTVLLYTNASPADRDIPDTQPFPPLDIHRFLP